MNKHVTIGAMFFLAGCTETRTTNEAQTTVRDVLNVTGQASGPGGMVFPVALRIERNGDTQTTEQSISKTQIDSAAIAQQVAAVVTKTIEAGMAKLTGLQPKEDSGGLAAILGAAGGGTGVAWALREMLARKREERALVEVKEARNNAQRDALEMAKKLPPTSV
jgi:malate/lactate dehydrogenase